MERPEFFIDCAKVLLANRLVNEIIYVIMIFILGAILEGKFMMLV